MATILQHPALARETKQPRVKPKQRRQKQRKAKFDAATHFWPNVDTSRGPEACHHWTGAIDTGNGYGRIFHVEGMPYAHRMAWQLANGRKPPTRGKRKYVLHAKGCVKACCNPDHLRLGTQRDNAADTKAEGRMRGTRTAEDALRIADLHHKWGLKYAAIAEVMGLSHRAVIDICKGRTWGNVTGIPCSGTPRSKKRRVASVRESRITAEAA